MQAKLAFTAGDLAQTRFAVSPMWEVVLSFRALAAPTVPALHRRWAEQVRPRWQAAGLDRGRLAALIPPKGYLADFLNPHPATSFPELSAELAAIRATPKEQYEVDLAHLPDGGPCWSPDEPNKVAAEIETYWELALAPYWARIRTVLEAEVFHRARQVAEHGAAHLLNDLHESVSWDDDTLRLVRRMCALHGAPTRGGLVLVPTVFGWPRVMTRTVAPDPPQLAYPARGIGTLWEPAATGPAEAVAAVMGRSRATLLAELETPASTTDLAGRTGLSAAGVSQHLTALRDAGLVSAHRVGRSVLYARTAVADSLLSRR